MTDLELGADCAEPGCDSRVLARRMCSKHYQRWRNGTYKPGFDIARSYPVGLDEQFAQHTSAWGDCLVWTGGSNSNGYGRVSMGKYAKALVHRVAYERAHGPIPAGLVVDHTCHNLAARAGLCAGGPDCLHRKCVNPEHLEAVAQGTNLSRSGLMGRGSR